MKKFIALLLSLVMALSLVACGSENAAPADETYTVGICQLVQHAALDNATQGFMDALKEELGDKVVFDLQNASNDIPTCSTIVNGFVADGVDLIMANATPALQAAAAATDEIPILGTSVTEYGVALDIDNFNGLVGGNISGTSDLAPLDQQAQMILDLFPETTTVGILYCSAEANSLYQANVVTEYLKAQHISAIPYTFSDSNDVAAVTAAAVAECDAIYIPTDNTAASCAEAIANVTDNAWRPVITGDEGPCAICGVATLAIDYYELGRTTGKMAAKILTGEQDISTMPIEYYNNPTKKYNVDNAARFGLTTLEGFEPIA